MEESYIASRSWRNARAFITVENGKVSVHGKFYEEMGYRRMSFPGPCIKNLAVLPEALMEEVQQRDQLLIPGEMSPELKRFVAQIWAQAEEIEPWFKVK